MTIYLTSTGRIDSCPPALPCCAVQEHAESDKEAMLAAPDSDEGLLVGQTEVTTPAPTKEARPAQDADSSPEVRGTPHNASSSSLACVASRCGLHRLCRDMWDTLCSQWPHGGFCPAVGQAENIDRVYRPAQCCRLQTLRKVLISHCEYVSRCWAGHEGLAINIAALQGATTPEDTSKLASEAAPGMKERLEEAQREIERLKRALEEGRAQQEWMLGNVVKRTAAQKEELTNALQ